MASEHYVERFLHRIDNTGDCWLWTGARTAEGYGTCFMPERRLTHEVSYEMFIGPIDDELEIRVECDNTACCCPHHLAATWTESAPERTFLPPKSIVNMAALQGTPQTFTLDEAKVAAILRDDRLFHEIAADYGVTTANIKMIRLRETWRQVPEPDGYQRHRGRAKKLTSAQAARVLGDERPYKEIAADYGISASTVKKIKHRDIWRGVEPSGSTTSANDDV